MQVKQPLLITLEPKIFEILSELNLSGFQPLIVGGAVRDALLGIEPKDIDIEVYKISYSKLSEILSKHGRVDLVGQKFGVIKFSSKDCEMDYDFSIPRKENKSGVGHTEFEITFDENITIKEAAERRDFTINALAWSCFTGEIFDFFGGIDDLNNKTLRHTSEKFVEDLLRILRAMQFQSRFNFEIHPSTIKLIKEILQAGEFELLSKERVFEEWFKWAEKGVHHDLIFKFMNDTGLIKFYPLLDALKYTEQDKIWHPEGNVEIHTELCLKQIDKIVERENITGKEKAVLVMSVLLHDVAKPLCTEIKEKHGRMCVTSEGHEQMGKMVSIEFLQRIGFYEELISPIEKLVANHLFGVSANNIPSISGKVKAVKKLSKRLHPATIKQLMYVMDADTNGRGGTEWKEPTGHKELSEIAVELSVTEKQYEFLLFGRHLIKKGLKPGLIFGTILKQAEEAQINGEFGDLEGAEKWLDEYLLITMK